MDEIPRRVRACNSTFSEAPMAKWGDNANTGVHACKKAVQGEANILKSIKEVISVFHHSF